MTMCNCFPNKKGEYPENHNHGYFEKTGNILHWNKCKNMINEVLNQEPKNIKKAGKNEK